ncbi:MAG: hypothetical protein GX219_04140 [Tissierellia bacterium]|nr:hypothetical protein [Tissierellia bacterium]
MYNKKYYKVSYFTSLSDGYLLECSMEIEQPNRRKKTVEKLQDLFMDFVKSCKIKEEQAFIIMLLLSLVLGIVPTFSFWKDFRERVEIILFLFLFFIV